MEIDHILSPLQGGSHEPDNLRVTHRSCNQRRNYFAGTRFCALDVRRGVGVFHRQGDAGSERLYALERGQPNGDAIVGRIDARRRQRVAARLREREAANWNALVTAFNTRWSALVPSAGGEPEATAAIFALEERLAVEGYARLRKQLER
jgi:hypothetical protein